MMKTRYARIGATTAIAAALALTPTIVVAQDVAGNTVTSTTTTTESTAAPAASDPASTETAAPVVSSTTTTRTMHVSKRSASPVHATTAHSAAVVPAVPAPATAPAPAPVPAPAEVAVTPVPPPPAAPVNNAPADNNALELGAGAVGILALGGIALALARRRRGDEVIDDYDVYELDNAAVAPPAEEVAVPVAPVEPAPANPGLVTSKLRASPAADYFADRPAFNWNGQQAVDAPQAPSVDRHPDESWTDRAYQGPSPDNPSLSLKKRLKRAAFFDRREEEAAAGVATPVDPDAGLPDALVEEDQRQAA